MKAAKKVNVRLILLSIVLIVAVVALAVLSYAWYSVSLEDVNADINVTTSSVFTFEVLHAAFFTPNDILRASVAYADNQYPTTAEQQTNGNIAKPNFATLDVDYKIYNAPENTEEDAKVKYLFYVSGLEIYSPGTISVYDKPLYKITVDKEGNVLTEDGEGQQVTDIITERVIADLSYSFADGKNADNVAEWTQPAVWSSLSGTEDSDKANRPRREYPLVGGAGEVYLAVKFNKYDDLIDEVIYNGLQIKVVVTMEVASAVAP